MEILKTLKQILPLTISTIKSFVINRYLFRFQHNAFLLTFKDDLLKWKPDIVHCNDWQTLSLGAFIKSRTSNKLIFDSHELEMHRNPPLPENRKRWMEKYETTYLRQCDFVTTVCEPISEYLEKQYCIKRPLIVYNSPIHPNMQLAHEDWGRFPGKSDVRKETNISSHDFLLVSVGNATVNRGIENILAALPDLPENIHLAIVGKITTSFKQLLQTYIESQTIQERVHFIEPVNPTCVVDFISTADAGIISLIPATLSYDYALPNKLFECVFARLPILASDTKEVQRKVKDYELGEIYKAGDVQALQSALLKIYRNQKKYKHKNRSEKQFIADHDFEACVGILLQKLEARKP